MVIYMRSRLCLTSSYCHMVTDSMYRLRLAYGYCPMVIYLRFWLLPYGHLLKVTSVADVWLLPLVIYLRSRLVIALWLLTWNSSYCPMVIYLRSRLWLTSSYCLMVIYLRLWLLPYGYLPEIWLLPYRYLLEVTSALYIDFLLFTWGHVWAWLLVIYLRSLLGVTSAYWLEITSGFDFLLSPYGISHHFLFFSGFPLFIFGKKEEFLFFWLGIFTRFVAK